MSLFSEQKVFCQTCGKAFMTRFDRYGGVVCGDICWEEREWRKALSIMGKEYHPRSGAADTTIRPC